jgi:hypothetical protein
VIGRIAARQTESAKTATASARGTSYRPFSRNFPVLASTNTE